MTTYNYISYNSGYQIVGRGTEGEVTLGAARLPQRPQHVTWPCSTYWPFRSELLCSVSFCFIPAMKSSTMILRIWSFSDIIYFLNEASRPNAQNFDEIQRGPHSRKVRKQLSYIILLLSLNRKLGIQCLLLQWRQAGPLKSL